MSDNRRDVLIAEMGLGPVWKLRGQGSAAPASAARDEAPAAPDEAPAAREPAVVTVAAAAVRNAAKMGGAAAAEGLPVAGDAREQAILGMAWPELRQAVASCTACGLCRTRRNTVFGVGDEAAEWMIVGEAPGAEEDARGEPFVGQAGRLLDNMLASLQLSRASKVYIANVLKCRPPGNRNPEPQEVAQCSPHLVRQVALIKPRLILAMGRFAAQTLLGSEASIASLRGRLHQYKGVPLIVTYHPAYLLRNLPDKAKAWEDLLFARSTLATAAPGRV